MSLAKYSDISAPDDAPGHVAIVIASGITDYIHGNGTVTILGENQNFLKGYSGFGAGVTTMTISNWRVRSFDSNPYVEWLTPPLTAQINGITRTKPNCNRLHVSFTATGTYPGEWYYLYGTWKSSLGTSTSVQAKTGTASATVPISVTGVPTSSFALTLGVNEDSSGDGQGASAGTHTVPACR